ncbi:DUF3630 family protein [Shewanella sp. NIFS-20-20]|uniref:DUF3630 family protein n=1 Tax=Shewanella sp. NIFS-20-20 TaxID=2853806 RepID=UPI001C46501F|nr:DUF3630 family protein [Shewanella sp. NIFS-20-20]MBV7315658.1 DUF3630 family protein [Shewanella sp. NIFS-20-20]
MPGHLGLHSVEYRAEDQVIEFRAEVTLESFETFALQLCQALDCRVLEQQWGADRHQWLLDFEDCRLWLHYEDYGQVCWFAAESHHSETAEVLVFLAGLMRPLIHTKRLSL